MIKKANYSTTKLMDINVSGFAYLISEIHNPIETECFICKKYPRRMICQKM